MANERIADYVARLQGHDSHGQALLRVGDRRVAGRFYRSTLASVFQSVLGIAGGVVGHEAYVRCWTGDDDETRIGLSPLQLFALAAGGDDLVRLDRLCRTVHAVNYFVDAPQDRLLFLGVQVRLLAVVADDHGRTFRRVLSRLGVPASSVVIEIPAVANSNGALLSHVVANYRYHGYRIALSHNWNAPGLLAAIDHVRPDVVRLRYRSGDTLSAAVRTVRAAGGKALVSHLESDAQVAAARAAGADLFQGYALGYPLPAAQVTVPVAAVAP